MCRTTLLTLVPVMALAACAEPPPEAPEPLPSRVGPPLPPAALPTGEIPPLVVPEPGPIRPGCGDYRLLVTIATDAVAAGARVAGPAGAVDVVWDLEGPGLQPGEPPPAPKVFNEDNREGFGIEANEAHQSLRARFVLLVSGVRPGQQLTFEMGQEGPGEQGTLVTIANSVGGLEAPGPTLATFRLADGLQQFTLDLCAAEAMPLPASGPALKPRLVAFYYPWWSTTAEPPEPYRCGGDAFGWIREVDGRQTIVTGHLPIDHDGEATIYTQTACWQEVADDHGRSGLIYDVWEPRFLAEQMQRAKASGLDAFAVSVHGDNPQELQFLQDLALPVASQVGFRVAPLYEQPESGWTYDDTEDLETLGGHLRALVEMLAGQPAALTIETDGQQRVVVFVDPGALWRFPSPELWQAVRRRVDEAGVPYFLWSGPSAFAWVFFAGFDGVYNDLEVVETLEAPLGLPPYALRDERRLAYRAAAWTARERGMALALPVVPGWEAAEVLWEPGYVALPRDYGAPGDLSAYYRVRWEDALEQYPDWIVVTSWNEWAEGMEVEPSDVYPPSRFNYLAATRRYACLWRGEGDCP